MKTRFINSNNARAGVPAVAVLRGIALKALRRPPASALPSFLMPASYLKLLWMLVPAMLLAACAGGSSNSGSGGGSAGLGVTAINITAGETGLTVDWTNPNQQGITGFNMTWENAGNASDKGTEELTDADAGVSVSAGARVSTTIRGLMRDATYSVTVAVIYADGRVETSEPVTSPKTGATPGGGDNPDADGDGVTDAEDNCRNIANPMQFNNDTDALGDACDPDDDNDGEDDGADNCPLTANADQNNTDMNVTDGGDACDDDDDNDGVKDLVDTCPTGVTGWASGPTTDNDNDGCRDTDEDPDDDNDEVADDEDAFPLDACASADTDEDGDPDSLVAGCDTDLTEDLDDDGDDVPDVTDAFRTDACASVDTDGDEVPDSLVVGCDTGLMADSDDDGDGEDDDDDNCPLIINADQTNTDMNVTDGGDACDPDDDNDAVDDLADACPTGVIGWTSLAGTDNDGDGCRDADEDVDDNNNSLIEIRTLDDLARLRDDLDGDGEDDGAIPEITSVGSDGCPSSGCMGYELARSLNFSDAGSYNASSVNMDDWTDRAGSGWVPIGSCESNNVCTVYTAMFDGRGYTLADLFISADDTVNGVGLFGALNGTIQNLHLLNTNISGGASDLGLLVGYGNNARFENLSVVGGVIMSPSARSVGGLLGEGENTVIRAVSVSGVTISGTRSVGGLLGEGENIVIRAASVSNVNIDAENGITNTGGLIGRATDIDIRYSYVVGGSISSVIVGGLIGSWSNSYDLSYSYAANGPLSSNIGFALGLVGQGDGSGNQQSRASYWDTDTTEQMLSGTANSDAGQTTAELQNPTTFTGIYADWGNFWCDPDSLEIQENRTDPGGSFERLWDLGDANQYPVLNCLSVSVEEQQQRQ